MRTSYPAPSTIQNLWGPEAQFSSWLSASFLLMTVSLLFYHMTRVQSLEMGPRIAGFFSVSLILVAVTLTVMALWTYFVRVTELLEDKTLTPAERNEKQFKFVYLVTGILIVLIEVSLCVVIVLGSTVKRKR